MQVNEFYDKKKKYKAWPQNLYLLYLRTAKEQEAHLTPWMAIDGDREEIKTFGILNIIE